MARQELNVLGGFYKDPNLHWSAQDVLNWIPVPGEKVGTRTRFQFRDAPGFKPFVRITRQVPDGDGFITVDQGPIRGMRNVEGKLFVVAGTMLYQITNQGVAVPCGSIPGVSRVSMVHNERGSGNQLLVVNGSAGYVFDTSSLVHQKITDTGYPGAFIADFADGYLAQIEPQGRYWLHSDLSQALDYNTFDQYEAEADPDRIISLHVAFREVLIFGADTIEPFVNTGRAQGTFQRASNTVIQCGCSAKFSPRTMDNAVFFLDDKRVVRRMDGYSPVRISTVGIEAALAECSREEIASAFAVTYEDRGHKIYYLTVPGRFTFGYDVLSKEWHRRGSPGMGRWRLNDLVFWNGKWIGGDFQSGRLYELDWAYSLDSCDDLERERVTGVISDNQNPITLDEVELLFNSGGGVSTCVLFPDQPEPPSISGDPPDGNVGTEWGPYSFSATGGSGNYVFTLRPGSTIPAGLPTLTTAGVLPAGTPTTEATYTLIVRVTDTETGLWDEITVTIAIGAVQIGFEWQYTGTFGNNATDICYGAEDELFLVCTQGLLAVGQVFTTPDSDVMTQRSSGVPAVSFDSCAWGKVAGQGRYVISQQSANVISTRGTVDAWAFTQYATDNANAYALTIHDGDNDGENGNGFIRAGLGGSSEHSATGIGGWASVSRPSGEDAICYTKMEWDNKRAVLIFGANGGIDRTEDGGLSYTTPLVADDPLAGANFGGAANDGTIIQAYKYSSGTLYTYTSIDGGHNFTVQSDVVGSSNYRAGKLLFRNGNWFGLGVTVTGGEQVELWCSPDGKVPWTDAQVQDYVDTYSATMVSIAASSERAILIGNKSDPTSSGYAMTSPVLTP